jgi:hypothetical protein
VCSKSHTCGEEHVQCSSLLLILGSASHLPYLASLLSTISLRSVLVSQALLFNTNIIPGP